MGTISYNYKISSLSYHDSVCTADINIFFWNVAIISVFEFNCLESEMHQPDTLNWILIRPDCVCSRSHTIMCLQFLSFFNIWCIFSSEYCNPGNQKISQNRLLKNYALLWQKIKYFVERDASSRFEVLARVAEEIKGRGTVAYINCGWVLIGQQEAVLFKYFNQHELI